MRHVTEHEGNNCAHEVVLAQIRLKSNTLASVIKCWHKAMPLTTTVIGSFPKPGYLNIPDWFKTGANAEAGKATLAYSEMLANQTLDEKTRLENDLLRATKEIIAVQKDCGVDVVTDGEVRRENYIHYLCRFIEGIDFQNLTDTSCRNGSYITQLPTVRSKVSWRGPLDVVAEWQKAQAMSNLSVKYTLPGPMTIMGTLCNQFYVDEKELAADLAEIVNFHARALAKAGCKSIQVDEPLFARQPQKALDWGIPVLEKCFEGVGNDCEKVMHMCCGYPGFLDQQDYPKADPSAYFQLAEAIDSSCVDTVSIEDAHCHNDLSLLDKFKQTTVILGVVTVASSHIESASEIEQRLMQALQHIDEERLQVAPDCGLAFLPMPILTSKLTNMCIAAGRCGCNTRKSTASTDMDSACSTSDAEVAPIHSDSSD